MIEIYHPAINFNLEQRMLHIIMQHSDAIMDIGLLHGKMGIVIFLSHYSRYTKIDMFEDLAENLIDSVLSTIHKKLPISFDSGLIGIGWAIEYLIQNKFIKGESLIVCKQIDKMIMQTDPRRLNDLTLQTGMEGLLHYILAHIQGVKSQTTETLPFDNVYLEDLFNAVNILNKRKINKNLQSLINKYLRFYKKEDLKYNLNIKPFLRTRRVTEKELLNIPLGIRLGLSGILLNKII